MTPDSPQTNAARLLRWRHPRLASALGRFEVFGPGPFEFLALVDANRRIVVKTASGEREIDAVWLDLDLPPPQETQPLPSAA